MKDVDSGRRMECYSNQPGFQFYPGKFDIIYVHTYYLNIYFWYKIYWNQDAFSLTSIGNFLPTDGSLTGKDNVAYGKGGGFVILTQMYPDSINQRSFPDDFVLRPGKIYKHKVIYKFFSQGK